MKAKYLYIALLSTLGVVTTSCVEYDSMDDFVVETPESVAVVAELKGLDHLKNYVDRTAYPNLKLGGAVSATEYAEKKFVHSLVSANFDEIVAENAMKYNSVVGDDGTMDFEAIDAMIAAAEEAEIGVYGHVLCWHAYNNTTYLKSLIADRLVEDPDAPAAVARYSAYVPAPALVYRSVMMKAKGWVEICNYDFEDGVKPGDIVCANQAKGEVVDGVLKVVNATAGDADWKAQIMIQNLTPMVEGEKYKVTFKIKSDESITLSGLKAQADGYKGDINNADGKCLIPTTADWSDFSVEFEVNATIAETTKLVLGFGKLAATVYMDDIVVAKEGDVEDSGSSEDIAGEEMILNGDIDSCNDNLGLLPSNCYDGCGHAYEIVANAGKDGTAAMKYTIDNPLKNTNVKLELKKFVGASVGGDKAHNWETTFTDVVPAEGADFYFSMDVKADTDYTLGNLNVGKPGYKTEKSIELTNKDLKANEWATVSGKLSLTNVEFNGLNIALGTYTPGGVIMFDNISFVRIDPDASQGGGDGGDGGETTTEWVNLLANGNFDGDDDSSVVVSNSATGEVIALDGSNVFKVANDTERDQNWEAQVHFRLPDSAAALEAGKVYTLKFRVKSVGGSTINGCEFQSDMGTYIASATVATFDTTTDWTEVTMEQVAVEGARSLTFSFGKVVDTFYFDDCILGYEQEVETDEPVYEPLTDEEKAEAITGAMENWIKEMMAHTSYVKAWDVINEVVQDEDATKLRNGEDCDATGNNFYWSDYMGKDFARTVVALAREYGGDDLLLFANDYGLQWYHDNATNDKLQGFLDWIEYWESDGVTKFDGLGTQMHLTYPASDEERAKVREGITDMFERMAATGKLIKVSELDIVMTNADEIEITTSNMTYDDYFALADFYEFIIQEYLRIVPAAQQYGITHWTFINNETSSEWRGGYPAGLWASTYERTINYAGYVNGLKDGAGDTAIEAVKKLVAEEETSTEE